MVHYVMDIVPFSAQVPRRGNFMDWKQILSAVDDDYLIGISNKGIVKRAYKDKEELGETVQAAMEEGTTELTVAVGGENVKICYPLGESKCSCPSRTICRHVVLGILLAKEQLCSTGQEGTVAETVPSPETQAQTVLSSTQSVQEQTVPEESLAKKEGGQESGQDISKEKQQAIGMQQLQSELMDDIKAYPRKPLLRALGVKALRMLVERMQAGDEPEIQRTSIITVKLPGQEMVVKLLAPLEYSTCTCHKKELCSHKAEAILWCQWKEKVIATQDLVSETETAPEFDRELILEAALQIKAYLEELMSMGLCRTSMEVVNTLERLAIVAHNAELPRVENQLRTLADTYARYLRRSASFQVADGVRRLSRLYGQIIELLHVQNNSEISKLAGEFRGEYKLAGDLDLVGVTWEYFISQSGYEGDTVYFLEENTKRWYTYTNARPTFYEGKKRSAYTEKAQAPWGLQVPIEGMVKLKIHLQGAKCDASGRLSSSQDTKGEIVDSRELTPELLQGCYYEDFGQAFAEQIVVEEPEEIQTIPKEERLVFLKPAQVDAAEFDEVEQILHMPLWDKQGRRVMVEIPYSKREDATIRYLERMKDGQSPCFVGRLYLKESQLQLYPLELFTKRELPWSGDEKHLLGFWMPKAERREAVDTGAQEAVLAILQETMKVLEDLYQVGFGTVQETILENIRELSDSAQTYGMENLSKQLSDLAEQIAMARHRMKQPQELENNIIKRYITLCDYVFIGKKKVMYDKAKKYYEEG